MVIRKNSTIVNILHLFSFLILITLQGCGKADIEPSCSSNGFGRVECSFHNKGNADGSVCVRVKLIPTLENTNIKYYYIKYPNGITSQEICSGIVKAEDVVERSQQGNFEVTPSSYCGLASQSNWSSGCFLTIEDQAKIN